MEKIEQSKPNSPIEMEETEDKNSSEELQEVGQSGSNLSSAEKDDEKDDDWKIILMKRELKYLVEDMEENYNPIKELIFELLETRSMSKYLDTMEWITELETRLKIHFITLKKDSEELW